MLPLCLLFAAGREPCDIGGRAEILHRQLCVRALAETWGVGNVCKCNPWGNGDKIEYGNTPRDHLQGYGWGNL